MALVLAFVTRALLPSDIELVGRGACRTSLAPQASHQNFVCEPTARDISVQFVGSNSSMKQCAAACRAEARCDSFQIDGCLGAVGSDVRQCAGKCFLFRRGAQPLVARRVEANPSQRCFRLTRRDGASAKVGGPTARTRICSGRRSQPVGAAAFYASLETPRVHRLVRGGKNFSAVVFTTVTSPLYNAAMVQMVTNFLAHAYRVGLTPAVIGVDKDGATCEALWDSGLPCVQSLRSFCAVSQPTVYHPVTNFDRTGYRTVAVDAKFYIALQLLRSGLSVLFADLDVVFLRDPLRTVVNPEYDLQGGSASELM